MKYRQTVWLPPDGDNRLSVLQETLANSFARWEFLARPPYFVVPGELSRQFPLECGGWREGTPGLELELWAGGILLGGLCLSEAWFPADSAPTAAQLPPPPAFLWKKGKLAVMAVQIDGPVSVEWSLENVTGWKVAEPKR